MNDLICVGAIGGAFGVRGEVRLKSFCAEPADIETYGLLSTEDGAQTFSVHLTGSIKGGFTARLTGVETKERADALQGVRLHAPRDRLPTLPDDEYYYTDLIGLEVYDTGGVLLGTVRTVQNHGASDILEIHGDGLKNALLVPFTLAAAPTVDIGAGRVIVDPPEGSL